MKQGLIYMLILAGLVASVLDASAQRRRNRNARISTNTLAREAEYFFTEGERYYILEDYAKAMDNFQKSVSINADNDAAYYKMAQINFQNEEYAKALANAQLALDKDSKNKYYYLLVIEILTQEGKFDDAAVVYDAMVNNIPGSEHYLYELAAIYSFQDKYDEAIKVYDRLESHFGFNERVAFERHKLKDEMGDTENAVKELKALVERFPDEETYTIALAEYYLGLERDEEAQSVLQSYLSNNSESPSASLLLGELLRKSGDYSAATPYLDVAFRSPGLQPGLKVQMIMQYSTISPSDDLSALIEQLCITLLEIHPEEANVHAVAGDYYRGKGELVSAAEEYRKSLELEEDNFNVWQNLILAYSQTGNFDKIILAADQALELYPNQASLYYFSGYAHVREKLFQEAVTMLNNGKRLARKDQGMINDFNSLLGEAYYGLKDYAQCFATFEKVITADNNNYLALNNYSYYLALQKQNLEKAEKMSARLIRENPDNPSFLDTHAVVLFTRKKYKEAKKIIEKAVDSGKATGLHIEHYGDILFKLGDIDGAVKQWKRAKTMDSTLELIDRKINDRQFYEK